MYRHTPLTHTHRDRHIQYWHTWHTTLIYTDDRQIQTDMGTDIQRQTQTHTHTNTHAHTHTHTHNTHTYTVHVHLQTDTIIIIQTNLWREHSIIIN